MPASSDPPANDADLPLSAPVGAKACRPPVRSPAGHPAGRRRPPRPPGRRPRQGRQPLRYQSTIAANGKRANARSILEILALGAVGGSELTLSASGPGAEDAVRTLAEVIASLGT